MNSTRRSNLQLSLGHLLGLPYLHTAKTGALSMPGPGRTRPRNLTINYQPTSENYAPLRR